MKDEVWKWQYWVQVTQMEDVASYMLLALDMEHLSPWTYLLKSDYSIRSQKEHWMTLMAY
tara:strand:+ start:409 stop:588 length:180 start_codon:yes stop_codon:yes gene_type:complete